ncbi:MULTISPECIES: aminotransferase class I/II-fold pyridoxal phosphate-dependent enzyme [unclassified Campylobacter]|uniref:aminotransferase class I/II-fold pyridoxal phosphate-dependent enzyme n=1 Tax=unclassified Campylobacter TaxID=2593542 RepID=UPI001237E725|nr:MULTISPECIES: pyridoxal phosphate-dependent aminotransferase family protein [unclassified Campylobacter]KAA6226478.1 pyridoxal phosphate-dependent aminotransferase family protein [Campylobacter sp. LR185c]KAA6228613.1 pyridoxal phosphate-dependent aminotransferase family protein [Campylobacter sp. LR196d]KAA6229166.1 pyridoxal phosphate-dependent aminotransferase family protein [Campylobacter sp. LR286c]KAA6233957.1 pyridoxal phosphate-dependent aminotransferase family protein [Campylobacter
MQISKILQDLKDNANFRELTPLKKYDKFVFKSGKKLLNLASNDYLNLSSLQNLKNEFLISIKKDDLYFSSTSSRSLSGNFSIFSELESFISTFFESKSCLHFNSGYHLNISCVSALASLKNTLFLADRQIHASMIDGLKLGRANFRRFKHNDLKDLESLVQKYHKEYENIIILSEALFSMDGDFCDLESLVRIKKSYKNILLYIDEAHSVGCFGNGMGRIKALKLEKEIDFIIFTFGKALSSMGACMICNNNFKDFFINKARAFIYSTALPPINVAWSLFIFKKLAFFEDRRQNLMQISSFFKDKLLEKNLNVLGDAYIISLILSSNEKALESSLKLVKAGFFAPAIKEPSVAKNSARIRFSLHSDLNKEEIKNLVSFL